MNFNFKYAFFACLNLLIVSCSDDNNNTPTSKVSKKEVIENYANIVLQNYKDALKDAQALETAIAIFTTTPTQENFTTAKAAWKTSRESYGTTEAFRFYNGPIDNTETGPEGLINSWPLDENYIDYVEGAANAGIINTPTVYPVINKEILIDANQKGDVEKNVAVGYHAIEFLLWGQDLTAPSEKKAGQRAYTDYTTKTNADRRKQYLNVCAALLTDHLQLMVDAWTGSYKTSFLSLSENIALKNIFTGIAVLTNSELKGERIFTAYDNKNQEDEHSCFSDNTDRDIRLNLDGIINVYKGSYKNSNGPSLEDLVNEANPVLGAEISTAISTAYTTINNTASPFDFAITDTTERTKIVIAINALNDLGKNKFSEAATAIGIKISSQI
ncbi:imelysin family protein [Tenacibaculum aestuariivivum]|uniref:imelysin family protein n=1 Tax=Tenacibaculum aestuariivivum TaxID=2006131 RepID=UPI003AB250F5